MAICRSGARFDKDSYYETIVDESNEEVMVRGTKNGVPVEYSLGGGGSGDDITITLNVVGNEPSYGKQFQLFGMPPSGENYVTGLFQIDGHYIAEAEQFIEVSESPVSVSAKIIEDSVDCLIGDEPIALDGSVTKTYDEEFEGWVCTITGDCTITAQGSK